MELKPGLGLRGSIPFIIWDSTLGGDGGCVGIGWRGRDYGGLVRLAGLGERAGLYGLW